MRSKYLFGFLLIYYSCVQTDENSSKNREDEQQWNLIWSDDFDDPNLNSTKWTPITGDGCPDLCGFGNNELQTYSKTTKNLRIENGTLIVEAHYDSTLERSYTSSKLVSKNKGDWQYGKVEIRAKLPKGSGTWTAFWMMPTSDQRTIWPDDGEIDIMENVGYADGWVYGAIHTEKYNGMHGTQVVDSVFVDDLHTNFHVYSIEWNQDIMVWYVDDKRYHEYVREDHPREQWPFSRKFHLILNLAVGGNWGGKQGIDNSIWPQKVEVDYVKVYQRPDLKS